MVDTIVSEVNIHDIYRQERLRWLREEAPRKSLRDVIAESGPYWIILVALVLYGLSAPHTASVFDKLTPGWGWIAPIGVEFGLLYTAFRRRVLFLPPRKSLGHCGFSRYFCFLRQCWSMGQGRSP